MAEYSGFFNAMKVNGIYDRVYDAEDFASYFANFISDGVFAEPSNQLKVVPKTGLTVTIKPGRAFIKGYWYTLTAEKDLTFTPNSTGGNINDVIICNLDMVTKQITVQTKENVSSTLRGENYIVLASFVLSPGISSITSAMITDRRPDNAYCGFVTGVVKQINYQDIVTQTQAQFDEWFEQMKGQLTTDAAGNLQAQIDNIGTVIDERIGQIEPRVPTLVPGKDFYTWCTDKNGNAGWFTDWRTSIPLKSGVLDTHSQTDINILDNVNKYAAIVIRIWEGLIDSTGSETGTVGSVYAEQGMKYIYIPTAGILEQIGTLVPDSSTVQDTPKEYLPLVFNDIANNEYKTKYWIRAKRSATLGVGNEYHVMFDKYETIKASKFSKIYVSVFGMNKYV